MLPLLRPTAKENGDEQFNVRGKNLTRHWRCRVRFSWMQTSNGPKRFRQHRNDDVAFNNVGGQRH
jgi:hypothetical protein